MGKSEEQEYYQGHEYQGLFDLMHEQHGLILLVSEMQDIVDEVRKMDSHSPTEPEFDTLQEGDWFHGTEEQYRKVLHVQHGKGRVFTEMFVNDCLETAGCVYWCKGLSAFFQIKRITKLAPEEFLRRAENTFKTK